MTPLFCQKDENNTDLFESLIRECISSHLAAQTLKTGLSGLEVDAHNPDAEIDDANRPILKIHSSCGNLIRV